ncbi:glycosyltransferase family 4 protein [Streptomyces sp. NPDC016309]|uniref:glycosyltransferase family 4 protein n=1 Tax=Streptomyces sp. NPDC016309 TaxID=3364965 RepID=UPI0036F7E4AD
MAAHALDQLARTDLLFLNWRDPSHPQAGGAEAYCFEIAKRFAAADANVTLFTARYPGGAETEVQEGVRVVRHGSTFSVYSAAARHLLRNPHTYDAVIDFQNGIPFFSPLFVPRWTADICVIHHIHQQQFDLRFRWPVNSLGRLLEKQVSRVVYRGRPVVVVSPSTREGTRRELGMHNPVHIVPNGSPPAPAVAPPARSARPHITVISRLVPHKRVDLLISAVPAVLQQVPDLRVDICGDGEELKVLRALVDRLRITRAVTFHGRVTEQVKQQLLARAWMTVVPSVAEGWGLTVIEANTVGTPALVYDVPGLRDSVDHLRNGWLLPPDSALADGINRALDTLRRPDVRERFAVECRQWAEQFSWDDSADRLAAVVAEEIRRVHRRVHSRRQPGNLSARGRFHSTDADAMEHVLAHDLRRTDDYTRRGDSFGLLLHDCDELRAYRVLRRLGVSQPSVSLATRRDILLGHTEPAA